MLVSFLKALFAGFCAAIPVGPIFLMVAQRSLCFGRRAGLMVGLGAAAGDALFALVGLFALSLARRLVEDYRVALLIVGGLLLIGIGISIWRRKVTLDVPAAERTVSGWSCALQAFGSTLSNPGAFAAMLALLSFFGLQAEGLAQALPLALAAGLGELLYWTGVSWLLARYLRLGGRTLQTVSRVAGALVIAFGVLLPVRGILMIIGN